MPPKRVLVRGEGVISDVISGVSKWLAKKLGKKLSQGHHKQMEAAQDRGSGGLQKKQKRQKKK